MYYFFESAAGFSSLAMYAGIGAILAGIYTLQRGFRRVAPTDVIDGTVISVRNDSSNRTVAIVEYRDGSGIKQKSAIETESHPSLGETLPLVFLPGETKPSLHTVNRRTTVVWGILLIVAGAVIFAQWMLPHTR